MYTFIGPYIVLLAFSIVSSLRAGRPGFSSRRGVDVILSLLHRVQTCSEPNQASYPVRTGASTPGGKTAWAGSWLTSI